MESASSGPRDSNLDRGRRRRGRARPALERLEGRALMTAGYFDTSFGSNGRAVAAFAGFAGQTPRVEAVAVQPDGKILVAGIVKTGGARSVKGGAISGEVGVARFTSNGKLDRTFGIKGTTNISFGVTPHTSDVAGLAVDSAGHIYVAGTIVRPNGTPEVVVDRLTTKGALDKTFGIGGRSFANFDALGSTGIKAAGIVVDHQGRAIVAGTVLGPNGQNEFGVYRLGLDGNFDQSFGNGGRSVDLVAIPDLNQDSVSGVALDSQGRIIVGGTVSNIATPNGDGVPGVLRVLADGSADRSFGNAGAGAYVGTSFPSFHTAGVAVDSQDRVVLGGDNNQSGQNAPEFLATRITSSGRLDAGFGVAGYSYAGYTVNGNQFDQAHGVAVDRADNIVIAGSITAGTQQDSALVRLFPGGSFDTTFGVNGHSDASYGLGTDVASAVTVDASGRLLVASTVYDRSKNLFEFGLARLSS